MPHPKMAERAFVLVPLAEIAPNLIHPVSKKTIAKCYLNLIMTSQKSKAQKTKPKTED